VIILIDALLNVKNSNVSKKRKKSWESKNLEGYLFILPLIIILIGFLFYSFYFLIKSSFFNVTISFDDAVFVGWRNYISILTDGQFWTSFGNTFLVSGADVLAGLTLGFLLAVFLSFKFVGKKFFNSLFFIPSMLPIAFTASCFSSMLEYKTGTLNTVLRSLNLGFLAQRWMSQPGLATYSVCSISIYLIGIPIMFYTSGLTTIDASVFDAAKIDGASIKNMLFSVLYPLLKNTHKTVALSLLLGGFRQFERVYMFTGGGPGGSTNILGTYIYGMSRTAGTNVGMVSSAGVLILLVAFAIAFVQMKFLSKPE
jgi:raffinose/stachyose/melibiose transport system permease protein